MSDPAPKTERLCLVVNDASGSYDPRTVDALRAAIEQAGIAILHEVTCPKDDLPDPATMDAQGIDTVAVFGGDGTISGTVRALSGWGGVVLPLPGGTMNLLCQRLHGDAAAEEIVAALADGRARAICPPMIRSEAGQSLVSISAGPGVQWYQVRETMRDGSLGEVVDSSGDAVDHTLHGPQVICREPELGQPEGYPLIELVPQVHGGGMRVVAYTAHTMGDYLKQGFAIVTRRFRDGPHDVLGELERVVLADAAGKTLELSFDGEPGEAGAQVEFTVDRCPVQLLATAA